MLRRKRKDKSILSKRQKKKLNKDIVNNRINLFLDLPSLYPNRIRQLYLYSLLGSCRREGTIYITRTLEETGEEFLKRIDEALASGNNIVVNGKSVVIVLIH